MTKYAIGDQINLDLDSIQGVIKTVKTKRFLQEDQQSLCYGIQWTIPSCNNYQFTTFEEVKVIDDSIGCLVMAENMALGGEIGGSEALLKERLKDAKQLLFDEWEKAFSGASFDFEKKQLLSKPLPRKRPQFTFVGQQYALQWALRRDVLLPESYHNQQTSRGGVWVIDAWDNLPIDS